MLLTLTKQTAVKISMRIRGHWRHSPSNSPPSQLFLSSRHQGVRTTLPRSNVSFTSLSIMFKFLVVAATAGGALAAVNSLTDQTFEEYIVAHNKAYDQDEFQWRQAIYNKTKQSVLEQNKLYEAGTSTWWAQMNKFADYTEQELKQMRGKQIDPALKKDKKLDQFQGRTSATKNPAAHSWMEYQTPVKNQGGCGSCWAFATTETLESHLAIAENSTKPLVLAPQTLVNCVKNPKKCGGTGGCEGAIAEIGFNFTRDFSMALESDLPYQGQDEPCTAYPKTVTCKGYVKNKQNSVEALETALATVGPVAITVSANWATYGGGIFEGGCAPPSFGTSCTLDHAVVAVGYTSKYWLVRNSWGESWGEKGYIRLTREHDTTTYSDTQPQNGDACVPYPASQSPMGESGILFDTCYPVGVTRDQ